MYKLTRYSYNRECGTVNFEFKSALIKFLDTILGDTYKNKRIQSEIYNDLFPITFEALDWNFNYTFEYSIKED